MEQSDPRFDVVNVREHPVPGPARLFEIALADGSSLRISTDVDGDASELGIIPAGADEAAAVVRLTGAEASTVSSLLSGVRLVVRTYDRAPREGASTRTITIRDDSPVVGTPFDEMAVFLRSPHDYVGLLGHAFTRAGIPAWFDRGTGRPHPSGRAFLALLGCAVERLSAARFAEYLSLSQVPDPASGDPPVAPPPADDLFSGFSAAPDTPDEPDDGQMGEARTATDDDATVIAGTLRAPWN